MNYLTKKSLILSVCLGLFLMASPVLAVGDKVIFDQTIRTGSCPVPLLGYSNKETDTALVIPHLNDDLDVTVHVTFPVLPTGSGTCDVSAKIYDHNPVIGDFNSAIVETTFVDGVEKIIDLPIYNVADTANLDRFYYKIENCVGVTAVLGYTSAPTDVYSGATSNCNDAGNLPEDLTLKISYDSPLVPPTTLDESQTGLLVGGLVASFVSQFTENLPLILAFMAGLAFLLLGIRWVKRSIR